MTTTTRTRRPRPKLVTLTDAAAERVREILGERGEGYLRVGVTNGGCAGMEYVMEYVSEIEKFDEVVEDKDVQNRRGSPIKSGNNKSEEDEGGLTLSIKVERYVDIQTTYTHRHIVIGHFIEKI